MAIGQFMPMVRAREIRFPEVEAVATASVPTGVYTSTNVPLPSGIQSGDLLVIFCACERGGISGLTVNTPAGWSMLYSTVGTGNFRRFFCLYKFAKGNEGSSVTVTASTGCTWHPVSYRISGATGIVAGETKTYLSQSGGGPGQISTPTLIPPWGVSKYLWILAVGIEAAGTMSTWPAGYGNPVTTSRFATCTTASAKIEAGSQGPYTIDPTRNHRAVNLVAIKG